MRGNPLRAYVGLPHEVYCLFIARLITSMGSFIMPLLTLILTQKLSMPAAKAGSLISLLILTQAPCVILGGKLADTLGRKRLLVASILSSAFFYLLCAFETGNKWMILNIILASDFSMLGYPAFDALLADLAGPEQRKSAYSLLYFGINIGMAFSMILGGLLFQNYLHLLFLLDASTSILCSLVIVFRVKERFHHHPPAPMKTLSEEVRKIPTEKSFPKANQTLFQVLKAAPIIIWFVLILFLFDFCYAQFNFMLPAQMGSLYGNHGARMFSLLSATNCITVILLTPYVTNFANRFSSLTNVTIGGTLYFLGYLGFAVGHGMVLFTISSVVFTMGEIMEAIQVGTFIANHTPAVCRGRVTAFSTIIRGTGNAIAPITMGVILSSIGYCRSWFLTAVIAFAGTVGMFFLRRMEANAKLYS